MAKNSAPAATKATPEAAKVAAPAAAGLTGNETLTLTALSKSANPMTRDDLRKKTGINKGWSKMLGATSKEDGGAAGKDSLCGRGLVKSFVPEEGSRQFRYAITASGKKALEKAAK